uniref:Uncharacterized protein n=1 Tax=Cyprinus carpio TaxID=7962 RepID=A0A8C2GET1_CYPCA
MSPISKTVAIFVAGREAASFSRLASNRGLYRRIGKRCANVGISSVFFCSASIFFCSSVLLASICLLAGMSFFDEDSASGNLGSSASTTMCFLRRDQPLSFDFMPFGFCITFKRGSAVREEPSSPSSFFSTAGLISCWGLDFAFTLSTFSGSVSFVLRSFWSSSSGLTTSLTSPLSGVFSEEVASSFCFLILSNKDIFASVGFSGTLVVLALSLPSDTFGSAGFPTSWSDNGTALLSVLGVSFTVGGVGIIWESLGDP